MDSALLAIGGSYRPRVGGEGVEESLGVIHLTVPPRVLKIGKVGQ